MLSPRFVRLGRQCLVRTSVVLRTHHELRVNPYRASLSRSYATPPPQTRENNQVSVQQYHQIADDVMDRLVEQLEQMIEDSGVPEYEVDYSAGVLTLKLDNYGTYVINKQPPNKQIWMSSPFSGPFRYDYDSKDGSWRYLRDGHSLIELLNRELAQAFREPVKLSLE